MKIPFESVKNLSLFPSFKSEFRSYFSVYLSGSFIEDVMLRIWQFRDQVVSNLMSFRVTSAQVLGDGYFSRSLVQTLQNISGTDGPTHAPPPHQAPVVLGRPAFSSRLATGPLLAHRWVKYPQLEVNIGGLADILRPKRETSPISLPSLNLKLTAQL